MPRNPLSKRSVTYRAATASKRDQREGHLQLAISELEQGQHNSIRKAAAAHNVSESTLRHRMSGRQNKKAANEAQQALTCAAENAVITHIQRCACSGFPLTPAVVMQYANAVSRPLPAGGTLVKLSHAWLQSFLLRHPEIKSHWSRCLDNARLTGTDEASIQQWFTQLAAILREYNVSSTNIYNMDETGFMFGVGGREQVVVPSGDQAASFKAQPGNRESATVIECIGSAGQVLPPLVITKGCVHTVGEQRRMEDVPATWRFAKSNNGWTNNELAVQWVETIFDPSTTPSPPSAWRLLILDGHGSHTSVEFCNALWSRHIIPFLFPPHATHVMQPLDVSIFRPLKGRYQHAVNEAAQHVDTIEKALFATFYAQAREQVLTQSAVRKAFVDSGITMSPSPDKVIARLPGHCTPVPQETQTPLQEVAVPASDAAMNATLDAFRNEPDIRRARRLKRAVLQANEQAHASIAILEAENTVLHVQENHSKKLAQKVRRVKAKGDQRVLSKDVMITREHAERELVTKGIGSSSQSKGKGRQVDTEVVPPSAAAAADRDEAGIDGDEALLSSSSTLTTPSMQNLDDELSESEPLSAIRDDEEDPFGFFELLPVAGPSRRHT
ncbi:related to transposase [Ustilago trichophora]|uniref:Related to transposase n=1 Tax=Ustilago trichophora TaxID=86804 RepID=A0A5C3E330_9BASI|nr:related to transposase [Ustilago trichophora]